MQTHTARLKPGRFRTTTSDHITGLIRTSSHTLTERNSLMIQTKKRRNTREKLTSCSEVSEKRRTIQHLRWKSKLIAIFFTAEQLQTERFHRYFSVEAPFEMIV